MTGAQWWSIGWFSGFVLGTANGLFWPWIVKRRERR